MARALLRSYVYQGTPIDEREEFPSIPDLQGEKPFILTDSPVAGYNTIVDVTDPSTAIEEFDLINNYWECTGRDFLYVQSVLQSILKDDLDDGNESEGFAVLDQDRQLVASYWGLGTTDDRVNAIGIDESVKARLYFMKRSHCAREVRFAHASAQIQVRLGDQAAEIWTEAATAVTGYSMVGILGTLEDENTVEGICDYIYGRAGTSFENAGLIDKAYAPKGMADMEELCDFIHDILVLGEHIAIT